MLGWMNTPKEAWDYASGYMVVCSFGLIFMEVYQPHILEDVFSDGKTVLKKLIVIARRPQGLVAALLSAAAAVDGDGKTALGVAGKADKRQYLCSRKKV